MAAFYIAITGSSLIYLASQSLHTDLWPFIIGIIITYMYGYTFIRARFIFATIGSWFVFFVYYIALVYVIPYNQAFFIPSLILLTIINLLGMLVSYNMELATRKEFLMKRLIEKESEQLSNANMQLALKNKQLENLSHQDGLTRLANRRYFDQQLNIDFSRCVRYGYPLSIVMIDVDYFKRYNDTLGHQAGDECLKVISNILKSTCKRPTDLAARYGGEEFVLILYKNTQKDARILCQSIQDRLAKNALIHPDSPIGKYVTVSIGISCLYPTKENNPKSLVKMADDALYKAKSLGRNRIEM